MPNFIEQLQVALQQASSAYHEAARLNKALALAHPSVHWGECSNINCLRDRVLAGSVVEHVRPPGFGQS